MTNQLKTRVAKEWLILLASLIPGLVLGFALHETRLTIPACVLTYGVVLFVRSVIWSICILGLGKIAFLFVMVSCALALAGMGAVECYAYWPKPKKRPLSHAEIDAVVAQIRAEEAATISVSIETNQSGQLTKQPNTVTSDSSRQIH